MEIGRTAPDVWVVDARLLPADGFERAVAAVHRQLPEVNVAVLRERLTRGPHSTSQRVREVDLDALAALLSQCADE